MKHSSRSGPGCRTIKLNSAIENSRLLKRTVICLGARKSPPPSPPPPWNISQWAIRYRGMHTGWVFTVTEGWFCRSLVMRPLRWKVQQEDPEVLVPTTASSLSSSSVSRFVHLRETGIVFCHITAYVDIPHWELMSDYLEGTYVCSFHRNCNVLSSSSTDRHNLSFSLL